MNILRARIYFQLKKTNFWMMMAVQTKDSSKGQDWLKIIPINQLMLFFINFGMLLLRLSANFSCHCTHCY